MDAAFLGREILNLAITITWVIVGVVMETQEFRFVGVA